MRVDPPASRERAPSPSRDAVIVFAIALAMRLGACATMYGLGNVHPRDYLEYVHVGERLLRFGTLVSPLTFDAVSAAPSAILPPFYSLVVGGVFAVFGVRTPGSFFTLQMINALASATAVALIYSIVRRLGRSTPQHEARTAAWIAASVAAVHPLLIGYTWMLWDTSLYILAVCLVIWIGLRTSDAWTPAPGRNRTSERAALWSWAGFGLLLGVTALLNPSLTPAYPVLVLWLVARRYGWAIRRIATPVVTCVLGWALAVTPWTIRNHAHAGRLFYVRNGLPMEFWLGVCPEADVGGGDAFRGEFPLLNAAAERRITEIGEQAFIDDCGRRAWEAIRSTPERYAKLVAVRAVDYWVGTVFEHSATGSGWPANRARGAATVFLCLEGVAVFGLLIAARHRRCIPPDVPWLLAISAAFSVLYCLTHVQLRYRAPAESLMTIAVGLLADRVLRGPDSPNAT